MNMTRGTLRLIITIPPEPSSMLARLAESECRDLRGQALYLLLKALEDAAQKTLAPQEGQPHAS